MLTWMNYYGNTTLKRKIIIENIIHKKQLLTKTWIAQNKICNEKAVYWNILHRQISHRNY